VDYKIPEGSHAVAVDSIDIPENRFRPLDDRVSEVAESYAEYGQLQPIILQPTNGRFTLVDGLHRLNAAKLLKWPAIGATYTDEIDPIRLREIELEVNVKRIEMSWQDRLRAIAELHQLRVAANPKASLEATAATAGVNQRDVSTALKLTKMMALFPEISKAKSINQALSWADSKAKKVLRVLDVRDNPQEYADVEEKIVLGDSVEVIKTIPDGSFNLVLTDPPFGINYDDRNEGSEIGLTAYEDDKDSYVRLLSMAPDLYRVIKPDGWLVWFLGISWYERAKEAFRAAGFTVDEIPIIWDRSEGSTYTTRPDRYFARAYDIALHCLKGDPQVVQRGKPNILRIAPVTNKERELLAERPVELYAELIRRLTVKGEVVADFFTGSGSCLAAAASLGREYFGVEMNSERRAVAIQKVKAHTPC